MVSKAEVLAEEWFLLRSEITRQSDIEQADMLDGYSRFWCKHAVLGAYWVAERVEDTTVRLHLTEDIELEGFKEALSFKPDRAFKRELLLRCNWEEVVREVFSLDDTRQLSLFGDVKSGEEED